MDFSKIDVSALSKGEKLQLYDLIQEYKRREKEKRPPYTPNSGQGDVHKCLKPFRWVFAGNGSGKTALLANETIWKLDGFNPIRQSFTKTPCRVIVVLDSPSKVADVWLPELQKWSVLKPDQLEKRGKPHVSKINWPTGSELLFMFHDQDPMLFESIEADYIVFDEPPPRHIYIALLRGLRKADSQPEILVGGTPIAAPWMRKEVYEPWMRGESPDTECFKFSSDVNKQNVNWAFVEQNIFSKYSEKELRIRRFGEFFDLEGLALAHLFERDVHVVKGPIQWRENWPCVVAVDPHPRKAHVAVLLGITEHGNYVALKEMSSRAIPSVFAQELKEFYRGYRVVDLVCDSLGSSELTGGDGNLSFIQVLKDKGVRIRATSYEEKQDEAFIQMIQEDLAIPMEADNMGRKEPRLKIHESCKGLISNIENVQWTKYRNLDEYKAKLDITDKDFLSAYKYARATQPRFNKAREQVIRSKGPVGWNKNERWRRPGR